MEENNMETIVKEVTRTFYYGDEPVEVTSLARIDKATNEEVYDEELDEKTIEKCEAIYRKRHHLIEPEAITEFRQKFGITLKELANLLNMVAFELELIEEDGVFPTDEQNLLLKLVIEHPETFKEYWSARSA